MTTTIAGHTFVLEPEDFAGPTDCGVSLPGGQFVKVHVADRIGSFPPVGARGATLHRPRMTLCCFRSGWWRISFCTSSGAVASVGSKSIRTDQRCCTSVPTGRGCAVTHPIADVITDAGGLVGATGAAAILGVARPNLRRYRDRLTVIPVAGSRDVYIADEVRHLAEELHANRVERSSP